MSRIEWSTPGQRLFQAGVDRCVLYVGDSAGVPWSGITQISETASQSDTKSFYYDGVNYLNVAAQDDYQASLSAFFSPPEFDACDGTEHVARGLFAKHQRRSRFGLTYRTKVGNDTNGPDYAYLIHIVYNAVAAPADQDHSSIGGDVSAAPLTWNITGTPVRSPGLRPTSHFIINSMTIDAFTLGLLEDTLYGSDTGDARLPSIAELVDLIHSTFQITVEDGVFTITAPDDNIEMLTPDEWQFTWPEITFLTPDSYVLDDGNEV